MHIMHRVSDAISSQVRFRCVMLLHLQVQNWWVPAQKSPVGSTAPLLLRESSVGSTAPQLLHGLAPQPVPAAPATQKSARR
jgi:hypothetical protein